MFTDWDPQYLWKIAYKRHIIVERTVKTHPLDTKFIVNSFQNLQRICPQQRRSMAATNTKLPLLFIFFYRCISLPTLTEVGILRFSDFPM